MRAEPSEHPLVEQHFVRPVQTPDRPAALPHPLSAERSPIPGSPPRIKVKGTRAAVFTLCAALSLPVGFVSPCGVLPPQRQLPGIREMALKRTQVRPLSGWPSTNPLVISLV